MFALGCSRLRMSPPTCCVLRHNAVNSEPKAPSISSRERSERGASSAVNVLESVRIVDVELVIHGCKCETGSVGREFAVSHPVAAVAGATANIHKFGSRNPSQRQTQSKYACCAAQAHTFLPSFVFRLQSLCIEHQEAAVLALTLSVPRAT